MLTLFCSRLFLQEVEVEVADEVAASGDYAVCAQLTEGKGAWRGGLGGTGAAIANVRVEASKGEKRTPSGKTSATFGDHGTVVKITADVTGAKLWSAESPSLYTLLITLEKASVCLLF